MSRIESQAVAGYYPTPPRVVGMLRQCLWLQKGESWARSSSVTLIDPCAGEGDVLQAFKAELVSKKNPDDMVYVQAIELEEGRATKAVERLGAETLMVAVTQMDTWKATQVLKANALRCLLKTTSSKGLGLLYLNPPYDYDRVFGRLEESFLAHLTPVLNTGSVLMFVVPYHALEASKRTLATGYELVGCWRFPDPEWEAYKQVVLVAKKTYGQTQPDSTALRAIEDWVGLRNLPTLQEDSFQIELPVQTNREKWLSHILVHTIDEIALVRQFVPFHSSGKRSGLIQSRTAYPSKGIDGLLQQSYPLAAPPKPAHVATAVAAGVFNGARVVPNIPGLPALLVKGVFDKEFRTVEKKKDKEGMVKALVQIQQPKLTVTVFDLENRMFRVLPQGVVVNENLRSVREMTIADLLHHYSRDMLRVMLEQCPVGYAAERDSMTYVLPRAKRRPYVAQGHTTRALARLYGRTCKTSRGKAAILLGEIGCGKTTVALMLVKMMQAKRVIVMCPPHLLESWEQQLSMIFPTASSIRLKTVGDVETFGRMTGFALGILSREAAKLDHEKGSVSGVCPSCGLPIPDRDFSKKRETCSNFTKVVSEHRMFGAIMKLARMLNPVVPDDETVGSALPQRVYRLRKGVTKVTPEETHTRFIATLRGDQTLTWLIGEMIVEFEKVDYKERTGFEYSIAHLILAVCTDLFEMARTLRTAMAALDRYSYSRSTYKFLMEVCVAAMLMSGVRVPTDLVDVWMEEEPTKVRWKDGAWTFDGLTTVQGVLKTFKHLCMYCHVKRVRVCGEPLYYSTPSPRRVALSTYIASQAKHCFDFLILDEGHEYASDGSAQEKAAHRLVQLGHPVLLMTGSIMNGYVHSLFTNLWYLSPRFREEFDREDLERFVDRYGYRKQLVECKDTETGKIVEFGTVSDRVVTTERKIGVAPGVLPLLVIKHLLPIAVTLHKEDLALELPPCTHEIVHVNMLPEQRSEYEYVKERLSKQIKSDMFTEMAGKLWGQMAELPSFLDRCVTGVGNGPGGVYTVAYPESVGGSVVASVQPLNVPLLPKERWLVDKVQAELDEGRDCLVFSWHVALLPRLKLILERHLKITVGLMDSKKVPTSERQTWIQTEVLDKARRVLVLNPVGVKTGINNLVTFSTAIWYENPACNPEVFRQAIGRLDRVGQVKPVRVFCPVYRDSLQEHLQRLLMAKVAVSLQTDGLDGEGALQAAGAGDVDLGVGFGDIGRMLFEMMQREELAA